MNAVLNVDTAKTSGWCITVDGKYHSSGEVDAFGPAPRELCARVIALDPLARLVLERPFGGNMQTLLGLGAAKGCWESAWLFATGRKTLARVGRVYPQVWRSNLFGGGAHSEMQEKIVAQVWSGKQETGPDENAAICIAKWDARMQVKAPWKLLGKKSSPRAKRLPKAG